MDISRDVQPVLVARCCGRCWCDDRHLTDYLTPALQESGVREPQFKQGRLSAWKAPSAVGQKRCSSTLGRDCIASGRLLQARVTPSTFRVPRSQLTKRCRISQMRAWSLLCGFRCHPLTTDLFTNDGSRLAGRGTVDVRAANRGRRRSWTPKEPKRQEQNAKGEVVIVGGPKGRQPCLNLEIVKARGRKR